MIKLYFLGKVHECLSAILGYLPDLHSHFLDDRSAAASKESEKFTWVVLFKAKTLPNILLNTFFYLI